MTTTEPRIVLTGATGRTGNAVAHALAHGGYGLHLAACVAPSVATEPTRALPSDVAAFPRLEDVSTEWDVLVDLTAAGVAESHVEHALATGRHVVLGTTGIAAEVLDRLGGTAREAGLGLLYVPNFSIGAVLMMRLAQQVVAHLPSVEVVETHHDTKLDAPSGTARRTAELLARAGGSSVGTAEQSRGLDVNGVRVHSVRLPGATAHQEVVFGAPGELLTIRHDAMDRSCYAAGVARAVLDVGSQPGLRMGLEQVV